MHQGLGRLHEAGIDVQVGDLVHNSCRLRITRRPAITSPIKEELVRTRRSDSEPFSFQTHCFYCGNRLSEQPRDQKHIHTVETLECRAQIDRAIAKRPPNDPWSLEVNSQVTRFKLSRFRITSDGFFARTQSCDITILLKFWLVMTRKKTSHHIFVTYLIVTLKPLD